MIYARGFLLRNSRLLRASRKFLVNPSVGTRVLAHPWVRESFHSPGYGSSHSLGYGSSHSPGHGSSHSPGHGSSQSPGYGSPPTALGTGSFTALGTGLPTALGTGPLTVKVNQEPKFSSWNNIPPRITPSCVVYYRAALS